MEAGDMGRILRCLEIGTVLTLFYQKKSQRPERRTFQVRLETRQIIWSRTPEKVEGDSEYMRRALQIQKITICREAGLGKIPVKPQSNAAGPSGFNPPFPPPQYGCAAWGAPLSTPPPHRGVVGALYIALIKLQAALFQHSALAVIIGVVAWQ